MEETHFEVCHSGNLPPIVACRSSTGGVAGGVHRQSTTDVQIQKCCVRIIPRFRTGGIRYWGAFGTGGAIGPQNQPAFCLFVSDEDNSKGYGWIFMKFEEHVRL